MISYPLIQGFAPGAVFALRDGKTILVEQFLDEVAALAAALPDRGHVINLCTSRYNFTVGLAAAMMRGQLSLLPPNDTRGTLAQMLEDYTDAYCLTDRAIAFDGLVMPFPPIVPIAGLEAQIPSFPAGQIAALLFTSGSTGRPKPQAKTWGGFVRSTVAAGKRLNVAALRSATLIGTVPHQHSYGIESTVLLALQHGLIMHDAKPLLPADIAASLAAASRPRILITAPIHLKVLLEDDGLVLPKADLIVSATAPLAPQTARGAEEKFSSPLYEIYGCSEAGQLATRRTAMSESWQCFDGITFRQDARGTWAQGDAIGDETLLNDVIELIDDAHFFLHGRTADVVNIAGKRSSLAHLNFHLNSIPGVTDGAFIVPDGEVTRLMAFVVAPSLTAETILTALRQHIDPAFLPRPLHLVKVLPRNELGKLPREELLRQVANK